MEIKEFKIPIDIYNVNLTVLVGKDKKKIENQVKKWSNEEYEIPFDAKGHATYIQGFGFILWIEKWPYNPETYNYCVHEVFHIADFILTDRNTPLVKDTEEVYAYLIGYLVEEILKRK